MWGENEVRTYKTQEKTMESLIKVPATRRKKEDVFAQQVQSTFSPSNQYVPKKS